MTWLAQWIPSLSEGFDWATRATAILAVAAAVNYLLRRHSASARHLVWSAALLGVLILPLVKWGIPGCNLPSWSTAANRARQDSWLAFYQDSSAILDPVSDVGSAVPRRDSPELATVHESPRNEPSSPANASGWQTLLIRFLPVVWGVGTLVMLASVALGALSLRRLRRSSEPLAPELALELNRSARELGLVRPVLGLATRDRSIPMTWGAWRPVVLLPMEAVDWSPERRRMVLLHELAHIQRWDFAIQLLGQLSRAMHWFNPLAWWAFSRLRLEQERACDDVVLNAGTCAADYASELVAVTRRGSRLSWDSAVALAISRFGRIEQRLRAILDGKRDRRPLSPRRAALLACLLAASIALVAIPRLSTAVADEPKAPAATPAKGQTEQAKPVLLQGPSKTTAEPAPRISDATLNEVRELIQKNSPQEVDAKRLTEGAIKGMLESLQDPYSALLSADEMREFEHQLDGRVVGIGAQLAREQDVILIVSPLPNSPAAKSGLKPRDQILSVGGTPLTDLKEVVNAIRGPKGTEVKLHIRREGQELDVTVTRDVVPLAAVRGIALDAAGKWNHWLDSEAKLAYLQITGFNRHASTEAAETLAVLHEQGLKGLLLDLRGCPGGLLEECVKTTSLFLPQGTVATVRSRQQPEQKLQVDGLAKYPDLPLLVLVDSQTASAAEVLAAALQDHQRAVIVGERTVGKGSVQTLIALGELGANVKITTAQLHRLHGATLDRAAKGASWGVDPDDGYYVPLTAEQRSAFWTRRADRELFGKVHLPAPLTGTQIEAVLADPALAAAFQSLAAKLKTGQFEKTGRPLAEMQAQLTQRELLRQQREELLQKLKQIDQQL